MKALTVRQPWAWAIARGGKDIENRTWSAPHRGPLAIHAGSAWDEDGAMDDRVITAVRGDKTDDGHFYPPLHVLLNEARTQIVELVRTDPRYVFGAVIAVVDVVDICTAQDCGCGLWAIPGQLHWRLANVHALADPVPCKGRLGLWDLTPKDSLRPSDVEAVVRAQLGAFVSAGR